MKKLLHILVFSLLTVSCFGEGSMLIKFSKEYHESGFRVIDFTFLTVEGAQVFYFITNKDLEDNSTITFYDKLNKELRSFDITAIRNYEVLGKKGYNLDQKNLSTWYFIEIGYFPASFIHRAIIRKGDE
jgi:hypothetical protein